MLERTRKEINGADFPVKLYGIIMEMEIAEVQGWWRILEGSTNTFDR